MAKKQSKNLEKVQSMVDGTYGGKLQSGYIGEAEKKREIGERWFDSEGVEWEQKKGYRSKITKMGNIGIFTYQCKDCKKGLTSSRDKDTCKRMGRCYYCQLNFEVDLKAKGKWEEWVMDQEKKKWETT